MVADGFYEWAKGGTGGKQPYYFRLRDGGPFAFAGLWERWDKGEEPFESCALITTTPNEVVAPVHNRMPAILAPEDYARWLDPETTCAGPAGAAASLPGRGDGRAIRCPAWSTARATTIPRCVEPAAG